MERLSALFEELKTLEQTKPETTFLSIGGRGYYENPTSDLLQFFLVPSNAHELGTLFVDALLEATEIQVDHTPLESLRVSREVRTKDDKRIDLLLKASGWILLIENKIRHDQVNPFKDYEALAKQRMLPGDQAYYVILSPSGDSSRKGWQGLSYRALIDALQKRLTQHAQEFEKTKWWHFAQDFTIHLDQELYTKAMTPKEIDFVETHQQPLAEAERLRQRYRKHLKDRMQLIAANCVGHHDFIVKDEGWAMRVYFSEWGNANIAWELRENESYRCYLYIFFYNLSQPQRDRVEAFASEQQFAEISTQGSDNPGWFTVSSYSRATDAEPCLKACAALIGQLYSSD